MKSLQITIYYYGVLSPSKFHEFLDEKHVAPLPNALLAFLLITNSSFILYNKLHKDLKYIW